MLRLKAQFFLRFNTLRLFKSVCCRTAFGFPAFYAGAA